MSFRQQLDPLNGEFTSDAPPHYSPAALVMLDYTWRLAGVRDEGDSLEWNVRPGHPAAQSALFRMRTDAGRTAEMKYDRRGAELRLSGKVLARIDSGMARLITDSGGAPSINRNQRAAAERGAPVGRPCGAKYRASKECTSCTSMSLRALSGQFKLKESANGNQEKRLSAFGQ